MDGLTPSQKGAIAEAAITAAAIELGVVVLRPVVEGQRYDLAFDLDPIVLRVQCKCSTERDGVLNVPVTSCRATPRGYVRTRYRASEIDAIAAYCHRRRKIYLVPIAHVDGMTAVSLRLRPTGNHQRALIRWAADYELPTSLRRYFDNELPRGREIAGAAAVP